MPVIQPNQPVIIQGTLPAQTATIQRQVPVQIQPGATLPPNVTSLQAPAKKATHIPLARCRVLYLGSAVPLETNQGIDAVQGPCRERYPFQSDGEVKGIDAWLSVFSSGILLSYVDDKNGNTWFPIQSLYVCTATKCVINVDGLTGEKNPKFVALDSEEAKGSVHPPMFATIMRRTKGKKVLECHVFITKSPEASMALVQSCTHAYGHKEGWSEEPPSTVTKPAAPTRLVPAAKVQEEREDESAPAEFFEAPPIEGYFYASKKDLVKNYNVSGGGGDRRTESEPGGRRQPAQGSGQTPPGAPGGPPPGTQFYPQGPSSTLGPPGAPVPPQFMPPPPGMMPPPQPGVMPPPGVGMPPPAGFGMPPPPGVPFPGMMPYPPHFMPPPPPGYFNDWDHHEGRPVAVFDERNGTYRPTPREPDVRHEREYRQPPREREYREAPRQREYREPPRERDYREPPPPRGREPREPPRERIYKEPPREREYREPPREYREPPREYREPPRSGPKEYREPPREYREPPRGRRTRSKSPRKYDHRPKSPSPPRHREEYAEVHKAGRRGRSPPVDYERKKYADPYAMKNYRDYKDDAPSDLILYAPRYRERLPEYNGRDYSDGRDLRRKREGKDFVEYTSNFNPEIRMKGKKDYRENRPRHAPAERTGYVRDDEDPYRYDRNLPRSDPYPRPERGFERSLQEERETIGDAFSDAYQENDLETGSAHIEYGLFSGLENTLGYYP